jgi:hypothetical protein
MYDIIGTLYTPGTYDDEGNELTPPVALPGWHVNSPHPVEGWEQYQVEPSSPRRVFAGHPTYCYVFPDEATFDAIVNPPVPEPEEVLE